VIEPDPDWEATLDAARERFFPKCDHFIQLQQPQLVISAIGEVVRASQG
jgi:hypothetical protein